MKKNKDACELKIIKKLREHAISVSKNSYAPYSNANIGAALITTNDTIYSGTNVENSSFGATVCAERTAIFTAISNGEKKIEKIYVYSKDGWAPCGMCRQVISEFAAHDLKVIIGDKDGNETILNFSALFPNAFNKDDLLSMDISND